MAEPEESRGLWEPEHPQGPRQGLNQERGREGLSGERIELTSFPGPVPYEQGSSVTAPSQDSGGSGPWKEAGERRAGRYGSLAVSEASGLVSRVLCPGGKAGFWAIPSGGGKVPSCPWRCLPHMSPLECPSGKWAQLRTPQSTPQALKIPQLVSTTHHQDPISDDFRCGHLAARTHKSLKMAVIIIM